MTELIRTAQLIPDTADGLVIPALVADAGARAGRRFVEFFAASIRNPNTRAAYARAVGPFLNWCDERGLTLETIDPVATAAYIELLGQTRAPETVKQHLAAIRALFDYLVTGGILPFNPAASVRGPKVIVRKGKTRPLTPDQARALLASIDTSSIVGLRDRALIGLMLNGFARISAVLNARVEDDLGEVLRLHEKGGKLHDVPLNTKARAYLSAYIEAAGIAAEKKTPLFRSVDRNRRLTERPLDRNDAWAMVKRRAKKAGLPETVTCHTFRATGITAYRANGGSLERAQAIAAHANPRTTALYDHSEEKITAAELERVGI